MRGIVWVSLLSVIFLSGCVTTRASKGSDLQVSELQAKVSYLESELERSNQKISSLEDKLSMRSSIQYPSRISGSDVSYGSADITDPSSEQIQTALKNAGYYTGSIDGKIGTKSKDAIMAFQGDNGLKVDGKVGAMTWSKLREYLSE